MSERGGGGTQYSILNNWPLNPEPWNPNIYLIGLRVIFWFKDSIPEEIQEIERIMGETNQCCLCNFESPVEQQKKGQLFRGFLNSLGPHWGTPSYGEQLVCLELYFRCNTRNTENVGVFVRQKPGRFEYTLELRSFHISRDWLCWAEMRPLEVYSISISLYLRTFGNKELIP